jgi:hypothetical protein
MNPENILENMPASRQESEERWSFQNKSVETIVGNEKDKKDPEYEEGIPKERIALDAFENEYGKEEIERDKKAAENAKAGFLHNPEKAKKKRWADALEIVIEQQISKDDWFGEEAIIAPTSEYDDYINHVDGIVEFYTDEESGERIALSIDASMGTKLLPPKGKDSDEWKSSTQKKLDQNIQRILGGNPPAEVKYFESQITGAKGMLTGVIPVVVGLDGKHSGELFKLFTEVMKSKQTGAGASGSLEGHLEAKKEELRLHPAQMVFLEEIQEQLAMYERLLENNPESSYTLKEVQKIRIIIENVIALKKDAGLKGIEDDGVLNAIRSTAEKTGRPS